MMRIAKFSGGDSGDESNGRERASRTEKLSFRMQFSIGETCTKNCCTHIRNWNSSLALRMASSSGTKTVCVAKQMKCAKTPNDYSEAWGGKKGIDGSELLLSMKLQTSRSENMFDNNFRLCLSQFGRPEA